MGRRTLLQMRKNAVTQRDLLEALRLHARLESVNQVEHARMERNGDISVIRRED